MIRHGADDVEELNEAQWVRISSLLPGKVGEPGRTASDNRLSINGCLWVWRSGAHWSDLPDRYGKWKTVQRLSRWSHAGVWERVFASLSADRDNQYLMIDSTVVRAHQRATCGKGTKDQALGRSLGGLTTKIHMLADALGRPLRFIVTAGQAGDITQAPVLLDGQSGAVVVADKAYDSNARRAIIEEIGATAVIPSNRTRKKAAQPYRTLLLPAQTLPPLRNRYDRRTARFTGFIRP